VLISLFYNVLESVDDRTVIVGVSGNTVTFESEDLPLREIVRAFAQFKISQISIT
jgi:hypothetical protein